MGFSGADDGVCAGFLRYIGLDDESFGVMAFFKLLGERSGESSGGIGCVV